MIRVDLLNGLVIEGLNMKVWSMIMMIMEVDTVLYSIYFTELADELTGTQNVWLKTEGRMAVIAWVAFTTKK